MADSSSFDVTTGCDLQEVDNAVNQAQKEISQRYDFKNIKFTIEFKRTENKIFLSCPDEHKLNAVWDVLQSKMLRRGVPIKNLELGKLQTSAGSTVRQEVTLKQGIEAEAAKKIVKYIKDQKLKKVQASIQGEQVRVASPSKDELQNAMALLKAQDFGVELNFGNYR